MPTSINSKKKFLNNLRERRARGKGPRGPTDILRDSAKGMENSVLGNCLPRTRRFSRKDFPKWKRGKPQIPCVIEYSFVKTSANSTPPPPPSTTNLPKLKIPRLSRGHLRWFMRESRGWNKLLLGGCESSGVAAARKLYSIDAEPVSRFPIGA